MALYDLASIGNVLVPFQSVELRMTREAQVLLVQLARPVQAGHQGTSVPRAARAILERQGRPERLERLERAERLVSSALKDARA